MSRGFGHQRSNDAGCPTAEPTLTSHIAQNAGHFRRRVAAILRAATLLAIAMSASACKDTRNTYAPPPPPKVDVAQPLRQPVTSYFELTGNTAPVKSVDLMARVQGFLTSIDYTDGAGVKQGAQLFTIEKSTYQAQLDQAQANLASSKAAETNSKTTYNREVVLVRKADDSQANLDTAKANYDQTAAAALSSQASVEIATINLGYTTVVAPFDGVVTNHLADVGSLVGVSGPTKLATIVQLNPIYTNFNVSEAQVLKVKESFAMQGRPITVEDLHKVPVEIGLQGEAGYPHRGHIDYVSPLVDTSSGTLAVRGVFENKDRALLPGYFVRVRVPIGAPHENLLVPDIAIGVNQEGSYILVLGKDNVVQQKLVKTGQRVGRLRVVDSGLDGEDWVVTAGIQFATPGAKVEPAKVPIANSDPGADAAASPKTP